MLVEPEPTGVLHTAISGSPLVDTILHTPSPHPRFAQMPPEQKLRVWRGIWQEIIETAVKKQVHCTSRQEAPLPVEKFSGEVGKESSRWD